jgi:hypothetical protein
MVQKWNAAVLAMAWIWSCGFRTVELAAFPTVPALASDAIRIGRPAEGGHLYLEENTRDATQRFAVYGAYGLPSIIDGRAKKPLATVILDASLSARDVDAIIANYKSAGPQAKAGGGDGGWRIPPAGDLSTAPGPEKERGSIPPIGSTPTGTGGAVPRLVLFIDEQTGRKRVIVETDSGRIELQVAKEVSNDKMLELIGQEIERGAELVLDAATQVSENHRGSVLLVTGFKVKQTKPIGGDFVAKGQARGKFDSGIVGRFRSAITAAFKRTTDTIRDRSPQIVDYFIDVKNMARRDLPEYELSGRIEMAQGGLRFVLQLDMVESNRDL